MLSKLNLTKYVLYVVLNMSLFRLLNLIVLFEIGVTQYSLEIFKSFVIFSTMISFFCYDSIRNHSIYLNVDGCQFHPLYCNQCYHLTVQISLMFMSEKQLNILVFRPGPTCHLSKLLLLLLHSMIVN